MTTTLTQAPLPKSQLLLQSRAPVFSAVQKTDVRLGMIRALAEYIEVQTWQGDGGREQRFKAVRQDWAEPEHNSKWPTAVIYSASPVRFEAFGMTPSMLDPKCRLPAPDGRYILTPSTATVALKLELWTNNPIERSQLCALMENVLNPVTYRYGFQLTMPHYFGAIATFTPEEFSVDDDSGDAIKKQRTVEYMLTASAPVMRLVTAPDAKLRFDLRDVGTEASVVGQAIFDVT